MNCSGHTFSEQRINLNEDEDLFPEVTREIVIRTSETTGMLFRGNSRGRWWYSFRALDTLYTKNVDYFDISDVPPDTTRSFVIVYSGFQVKISKDCHGDVSVSAESIPGMIG